MLWRPTYQNYKGNDLHTRDKPLPADAQKFVLEKNDALNGPTSNRQDNGGYFF